MATTTAISAPTRTTTLPVEHARHREANGAEVPADPAARRARNDPGRDVPADLPLRVRRGDQRRRDSATWTSWCPASSRPACCSGAWARRRASPRTWSGGSSTGCGRCRSRAARCSRAGDRRHRDARLEPRDHDRDRLRGRVPAPRDRRSQALLAFGLCLVFGFAFEWLFITLGLFAGNAQAAQGMALHGVPADVRVERLRPRRIDAELAAGDSPSTSRSRYMVERGPGAHARAGGGRRCWATPASYYVVRVAAVVGGARHGVRAARGRPVPARLGLVRRDVRHRADDRACDEVRRAIEDRSGACEAVLAGTTRSAAHAPRRHR